MADLTFDTVKACVNVIRVNEVVEDVSHSMEEKVCKSSQVEAQVFTNDASPSVRTNDIPVGGTTIHSELIKVRYKDRDTFIQVFYDKGSQLSLVNKYCTLLVVHSRKSDKPIHLGMIE